MEKRARIATLDFWIIALMLSLCFGFLVYSEVIPSDFFLSERFYKKDPHYYFKKEAHRMMLCHKSFYNNELTKYYDDPELFFKNAVFVLKSKYKNKETAVIAIDDISLVVHKYYKKNLLDYLLSIPFKPSEAFRGWYYGQILMKNKIACSKPILVIEKRIGPYCTSSYLVTSYITGLSGYDFFKDNSPYQEKWAETTDNIQQLLTNLNKIKVTHSDFELKSIIVKDDLPYLVDLDKLQRFRYKSTSSERIRLKKYFINLKSELNQKESKAYQLFEDKTIILSN